MTETIINSTILIAPAAILIGIIVTLVFLLLRRTNNIRKILNEINRKNNE